MAETKINFSDYPASGVYFLEIDNSVLTQTSTLSALRLAVGFNMRGPFNRPVYVDGTKTYDALFGGIDRKLERRGCFTNRNIRTMLRESPVFALNLMPINTSDDLTANLDKVGAAVLNLDASMNYGATEGEYPYAYMYDRSNFWIADDSEFVNKTFVSLTKEKKDASANSLGNAEMFGVANCGTEDISVIVRKAEGLSGYNVTFAEYFGGADNVPYKWINPNDFLSDYFVQVIAVKGNWGSDRYQTLVNDSFWKSYFTAEGIKKEQVNKFIRLDQVGVVGSWVGCVIPDFYDKQGNNKSIDFIINKSCNETGLMFGVNKDAMELISLDSSGYFLDEDGSGKRTETSEVAKCIPDFVGNTLTTSTGEFKYMSCNMNPAGKVNAYTKQTVSEITLDSSSMFIRNEIDGANVAVGDLARGKSGAMTRIIKKRGIKVTDGSIYFVFTAYDVIGEESTVEVHKAYSEMYNTLQLFYLKGLKICNRHMPGFDASGAINTEAGLEKIYGMLEDDGIHKGILNADVIDFRYVVDTFANGLGDMCGGKRHLSNLAMNKSQCLALINSPSMSEFAASDEPFFGDTKTEDYRSIFKVKYIPEGGNQDLVYSAKTESFTIPNVDNGSQFAAVFAPFLKYGDGSKTILVPPAADVSNTFIRKYNGGNPYSTAANLNGIIINGEVTGVEMMFDAEDRGYLEPFGINPIINRNGTVMIYGDRTAYQDVNSDLNFIHVREILNTIKISCKAILDEYVYTYNTPLTRAEIVSRITPILAAMKASEALAKYEIECDSENNTKTVIDNKFCIVNIGVWINQNMEKIVVPITVNRSTTA